MKIKTIHVLLALAVGVAITNQHKIVTQVQISGERQNAQAEQRRQTQEERQRKRQIEKDSAIALERYRAGCEVVDYSPEPGVLKQIRLLPGVPVTSNGETLRDGTLVCNELGDTGVSIGGTIQQFAAVSQADIPAFAELQRQIASNKRLLTRPHIAQDMTHDNPNPTP